MKGLLLDPQAEWPAIEREPNDTAGLLKGYVAVLAAIPAMCGFIGGRSSGRTATAHLLVGVVSAVGGYILTFIGVFVVAFVIDALAEIFGGRRSFANALKIAAFLPTAAWLASAFTVLPVLTVLSALGLYSFYLLYTGLPALMKAPPRRAHRLFPDRDRLRDHRLGVDPVRPDDAAVLMTAIAGRLCCHFGADAFRVVAGDPEYCIQAIDENTILLGRDRVR